MDDRRQPNTTDAKDDSVELAHIFDALGLEPRSEPPASLAPSTRNVSNAMQKPPTGQKDRSLNVSDIIMRLLESIITPGTFLHGLAVFVTILVVAWLTLAYVMPVLLSMLAEYMVVIVFVVIIFFGMFLMVSSLFRR